MKKLLLSVIFTLGTLAMSSAHAEIGVTKDSILIGSINPLSGPPSLLGRAHWLALQVWIKEVNERGGINGRKIKLVAEDDGYVPARTRQMAKKLIAKDKVFAFLGTSGSSHLLAIMPLLDKEKVPVVNTLAVNTAHFSPPHETVFNIGATYCMVMEKAVEFAVNDLGKKDSKYVLIYQDDDYGKDTLCGYRNGIKQYGIKDVGQFKYRRGQKDFSAEILKAKATGADVLISGGVVAEHAIFMKEAKKIGWDVTMVAMYAAHLPPVQALMAGADNGYYAIDYVPPLTQTDIPGVKRFMDNAKKYLSEKQYKGLNRYSLASYVGSLVMEEAIKQCGDDLTRTCVVNNIEKMDNFQVGGLMSGVTFGKGNRFSISGVMALQSEPEKKKFKMVTKPKVIPVR